MEHPSVESPSIKAIGETNKMTDFLSTDRILELSPRQTVDYLTALERDGRLKEFLLRAVQDESLLAQLSYWEKWLSRDHQATLEKIIERKREIYPPKSESLPLELEKKFSERELRCIFLHIQAIQLTYGCSIGCAFCGLDAVKNVREHIPYSQLANLFKRYALELANSRPFLYWASEPADYVSKEGIEDKTYADVHQLAVQYAGYDPYITSFQLRDPKWLDFMGKSFSRTGKDIMNRRLSVFGLNETQLTQLRRNVSTGERRVDFVGEVAPNKTVRQLKGIGYSINERENDDEILVSGIACFSGPLLTPRGLYNLVTIPISEEYPQGIIIAPIEKVSTDATIQPGDKLKSVMSKVIVIGKHTGSEGITHQKENGEFEKFQRYVAPFPKTVKMMTVDDTGHIEYTVHVDKHGIITRVWAERHILRRNDVG